MAYLTIGEDIYRYNEHLFCEILESLDSYTMSKTTERIVTIHFDSDKFGNDEFCLALIKNNHKTKEPYFFRIINASHLNRHLMKESLYLD